MTNEKWFNTKGDICPKCKDDIDFQRVGGGREEAFQVFSGSCNCGHWVQETSYEKGNYTITSAYQE